MKNSYDIVIVGSGIAGLSTVLYLSQTHLFKEGKLSICLIAKGSLSQTNSHWAQGGIATVNSMDDNFDKHIQDTINAGAYINNTYIVDKVVKAAPSLLKDLMSWGTSFDKTDKGAYDLAKEGGHSHARIWHHKDETGKAIQNALMHSSSLLHQLTILEHSSVINATIFSNKCFGLKVYDSKNNATSDIFSTKLVLATGGLGMLYDKSTNQTVATGDGIYLASQLGATIENLSFIQFHPTGLYENGQISFLISEALRGAGAILRNEMGEAFMYKYDERLDLAPRDIVSRAIVAEIATQKNSYVYLDATKIDIAFLNSHFPAIKQECMHRIGLNIEKDFIPIVPVQHYSCGGVNVDEFSETSIKGLFVIGELASTGLHGANRLASNSLLEAIAFAKFAVPKLLQGLIENEATKLAIKFTIDNPLLKNVDRKEIQLLMSKYAGIVKTNEGLKRALEQLLNIKNASTVNLEFNLYDFESNCILEASILLIQDALRQTSNKGVYYNTSLVN